jgi:hypothetical protein
MRVLSRRGKNAQVLPAVVAGFASFVVMTWAAPAAAKRDFPGVIQEHWGGDCAPLCTLCHTRPEGGLSDAEPYLKPSGLDSDYDPKDLGHNRGQGDFFANLIAVNSRAPTSNEALVTMLGTLNTKPCSADTTLPGNTMQPCDSDGDKMPDMKEFARSSDPNVAGGELCVGPKYGCGASIGPLRRESTATGNAAVVVALLGLMLVFTRRVAR